ncbi:ABC transporter substrate-binding protein [Tessaracoccus sp.]
MHLPEEALAGLSRRSFVKLLGASTAAAGIAASLTACGTTTPGETTAPATTGSSASPTTSMPAASPDGVITAGISYELGTNGYDPMTTTAALTIAANWHTMEGLTEIDPATREVYKALAAELPKQIDDTTWEVALRDGAVFTNGEAVTADDVVFSFERVLDEANQSLYRAFLPFLASVAKKDDTTVTFTLNYAFSLVAERLAVVKIVPMAAVTADAKAFDLAPIGSGPFTMTDNGAASQKIVFERNDKYTGDRPAMAKTMTWQILPDASTRTNALSSDTVQAIDSVPASDLATLSQTKSVAAEQGFGLVFMMFNCGSEPMMNVKNRQAMMYALDYDQICSVGMSDLAAPATCFVQKEHPSYKEAATVYTKDVEKAKALLAETGLTKVRLLASDHGFFSDARPIIKESLEAVGLTVTYEEKKSSDVYATIDGAPEAFDMVVAPGDPSVFGNDADLLLRWWYAGDTWTDSRMHWKGSDSYTKVQELLEKAGAASGDEQLGFWHEIFDVVAENVPLYPIFHRKTPTAFNPETLQGFKPLAVTGLSFLDVASSN